MTRKISKQQIAALIEAMSKSEGVSHVVRGIFGLGGGPPMGCWLDDGQVPPGGERTLTMYDNMLELFRAGVEHVEAYLGDRVKP